MKKIVIKMKLLILEIFIIVIMKNMIDILLKFLMNKFKLIKINYYLMQMNNKIIIMQILMIKLSKIKKMQINKFMIKFNKII